MERDITVLYVDDEEINLKLFVLQLKSVYNIITATSGQEGLVKLQDYKDDIIVVISDMRMPHMDGVDFIEEARKEFENIAYFILTGFEYNDKIDQAMKRKSIHRFFKKPFIANEIKEAIQDTIKELGLTERLK